MLVDSSSFSCLQLCGILRYHVYSAATELHASWGGSRPPWKLPALQVDLNYRDRVKMLGRLRAQGKNQEGLKLEQRTGATTTSTAASV